MYISVSERCSSHWRKAQRRQRRRWKIFSSLSMWQGCGSVAFFLVTPLLLLLIQIRQPLEIASLETWDCSDEKGNFFLTFAFRNAAAGLWKMNFFFPPIVCQVPLQCQEKLVISVVSLERQWEQWWRMAIVNGRRLFISNPPICNWITRRMSMKKNATSSSFLQ